MSTFELATSLIKGEKVLQSMGVSPSPITTDFCTIYTEACFKDDLSSENL